MSMYNADEICGSFFVARVPMLGNVPFPFCYSCIMF